MKYFFLIAFLFGFQAFTQTDCETSKLALEKTEAAYKKSEAANKKNWEAHTKANVDYQNAYYAWQRAVRIWAKAKNDDPLAKIAWKKADIAFDKAVVDWKKAEVAWAKAKVNDILKKPFEEAKKIKVELIKACKIDSSKTKLIFPYWSANPIDDIPPKPRLNKFFEKVK